jgi:hypothetical protein
MKLLSVPPAPRADGNRPRIWHPEKFRFRQAECDHAVRQAIRSRNLAIRTLEAAEADRIISSQEAEMMRAKLG